MSFSVHITEEEKYYFGLRGYLIVRGVLSAGEIDTLNASIGCHAKRIREKPH